MASLRPLLLVALVLLLPVLPMLAFGGELEAWTEQWIERPQQRQQVAAGVVLLLAADMVLPVPSSAVATYAGSLLSWPIGAAVTLTGLSVGAIAVFALARLGAPLVARRIQGSEHYESLRQASDRYGAYLIVICRGLPVLAEASVILSGLQGMRWRVFLPALVLSNLGLSVGYAVLGELAQAQRWLPLALCLATLLPLLAAAGLRRTTVARERKLAASATDGDRS